MKNVWFSLLVFFAAACNNQQDSSRNLSPSGFEKGIAQKNAQVLDVRTAGEYKSGHIKNALQANWNDAAEFSDRISYIDKNKPVYVYCLAGGRSAAAAEWMRNNGFKTVYELSGGMNAWKQEDKPVEGMSTEPQMTIEQYQASIPNDKTVLVDIGADWCPPCITMKPVIDEIEKSKGPGIVLLKIDAGVHMDLLRALNVVPIPVFIVYKNGVETFRHQGIIKKEELEKQL